MKETVVISRAKLNKLSSWKQKKNPIAEGDFEWIFACNCEGTEQLRFCFLTVTNFNADYRR